MNTNKTNEKQDGTGKLRQNARRGRETAKNESVLIYAIVGILALSIIVLAIALIVWNPFSRSPDETGGPSVDTGVPFETQDVTGEGNPGTSDAGEHGNTTPSVVYTRKGKTYNFLIIGKDKLTYNTDVIIIAHFDENTGEASLVQIPRDTYINVGTAYRRVNTLYGSYFVNLTGAEKTNPEKSAMEKLVKTLQSNLNIKIDTYCLLYLDAFVKIVDAAGGVYVDVPIDMYYDDPEQDLHIDLVAGYQRLNGDMAEQFVRYRSGYIEGDIGRVDAQKIFLSAFIQAVKNNFTVSTVSTLCSAAVNSLITDMTLKDAVYYAQQTLSVDLSSVTMMTLPGQELKSSSGAWYYIVNREGALNVVNTYLNVYNENITDGIFDRNGAFNNKEDEAISEKYYQTGLDPSTYTGDKAAGIDISHYENTGKPQEETNGAADDE